jgi:hypothetical protein
MHGGEPVSGLPRSPRRGRPARNQSKGVVKGSRLQISFTITPELLDKVDGLAGSMGQTRAAVINLAIYRLLALEAAGNAVAPPATNTNTSANANVATGE